MKERKLRAYHARNNANYPSIILQGKWLAELGFEAGDYLSIKCRKKQVTISILKKNNQE